MDQGVLLPDCANSIEGLNNAMKTKIDKISLFVCAGHCSDWHARERNGASKRALSSKISPLKKAVLSYYYTFYFIKSHIL